MKIRRKKTVVERPDDEFKKKNGKKQSTCLFLK